MISSPRGTEMFHFPRCRPPALFDSGRGRRDRPAGLPHSETHGSRAACASPWNIAACRVLPAPRRGISPLAASFFAIRCQGIRHAPEKLVRRNPFPRPRLRTLSMPLREAARRAGAGSPFCILMLPSKSFYLSLPVVKEHPRRVARRGENSGMVGAPGLEPGTSSLSEKRSNQLSYAPAGTWWSRRDSNPRHPACKAGALPAELRPPRRAPAPRESSGAIRDEHRPRPEHRRASLIKGGDPAAGSPTATLLRLHPSHRPYLRRLPPRLRVWSAPMM